MNTRIEDRNMVRRLFLLCWFVYFVTYIGRLNYSAAMPVMMKEGYLLKSQAGTVSMVFFLCYGIGQLVNGFLGDRLKPVGMITAGLVISAGANVAMSLAGSYLAMAVFWGINGYAQSMIWPPIVRIFSDRLQPEARAKACIHITSTVAAGTLAAYFLSAAVLAAAAWQMVFVLAAAIMGGSALVWQAGCRKVERFAASNGKAPAEEQETTKQGRVPFYKVCLCSGLLLLILPVIVHGVLKDGMTNWVPTYITELFGVSPVVSVLVTMVLPIVNLTGAYAASFVNRRFFRNELKTSAFFFAVAACALVLLFKIGSVHVLLAVVMLSVITSSMLAVNTLFVNVIPMYFGKIGRSATVSGFLNAMAYLGAAVSTFTIGIVVEGKGWDAAILGWLVIAAAAAAVCVLICRKELKYRQK